MECSLLMEDGSYLQMREKLGKRSFTGTVVYELGTAMLFIR